MPMDIQVWIYRHICLTAALITLKLVVKSELSRWASDECLFQGLWTSHWNSWPLIDGEFLPMKQYWSSLTHGSENVNYEMQLNCNRTKLLWFTSLPFVCAERICTHLRGFQHWSNRQINCNILLSRNLIICHYYFCWSSFCTYLDGLFWAISPPPCFFIFLCIFVF